MISIQNCGFNKGVLLERSLHLTYLNANTNPLLTVNYTVHVWGENTVLLNNTNCIHEKLYQDWFILLTSWKHKYQLDSKETSLESVDWNFKVTFYVCMFVCRSEHYSLKYLVVKFFLKSLNLYITYNILWTCPSDRGEVQGHHCERWEPSFEEEDQRANVGETLRLFIWMLSVH